MGKDLAGADDPLHRLCTAGSGCPYPPPEAGGEGRVLYRREGEAERSWSIRDRLCLRTGPEGMEPIDFTLADRLFRETEDYWREKTGALWFDTPDQALNRYLNGWAPIKSSPAVYLDGLPSIKTAGPSDFGTSFRMYALFSQSRRSWPGRRSCGPAPISTGRET